MKLLISAFFGLCLLSLTAQEIAGPIQPLTGPGGAEYVCDSVIFQDFARRPDGYWLFEPAAPRPDSARVVVFMHGYGAYNPMIYGEWINHLVRRGNIVIFPRYQRNLIFPRPPRFGRNASQGIRDALVELDTGQHVRPIVEPLVIVGHSYGGVVAADLGVNFEAYEIPQPKGLLLCAPGSGPFRGGRLKSYEQMPEDTYLLVMVSDNDRVVGDKFGHLVYETAVNTPHRNLIRQYRDDYGSKPIRDGHNESYSLYPDFDIGKRNFSSKRALSIGRLDAVDYYGYWKLLDALIDYTANGTNYEYAFGNTPQQTFLGEWSDGTPIRPLEVWMPEVVVDSLNRAGQEAMMMEGNKD
ncbi:MAG: hypothetical protein DHS20C18_50360 [Saprospiraceae bacterium]|nr:MAG: hypothetical protein DHS20C18_50360 [Saprospiraceae bacterium]